MITWSIILESMILTVWILCSSMAPFTQNHFWSKRVTENCLIHPETFISEKLIQQNIYSNWYWSDIRFICTKLLGLTSSYLHFLPQGEIITPVKLATSRLFGRKFPFFSIQTKFSITLILIMWALVDLSGRKIKIEIFKLL